MRIPATFSLLFSIFLLLTLGACQSSPLTLLEKAKAMQNVSVDSISFYLWQIKHPEKLPAEQQGDYCLLSYRTTLWRTGTVKDSLLHAALRHYKHSPNVSCRLQTRCEQAAAYLYKNLPDSALLAAEELCRTACMNDTIKIQLYGIRRSAYLRKKEYPQASAIGDSCRRLALQLADTLLYFQSSQIYLSILRSMNRTEEYFRQYQTLIDMVKESSRFRYLTYRAYETLVKSCLDDKDFQKARQYNQQLPQYHYRRYDIPYRLFLKGEIHKALNHIDSARYYYSQTASSASDLLAIEANSRLIKLINEKESPEQIYYLEEGGKKLRENVLENIATAINRKEFNETKLQNELYSLRLNQQRKELGLMGIAILLLFIGLVGLFFYHQEKKKRLLRENQLLHQEAELSALREKEILLRNKETELREALFRRISFFRKLPSLHHRAEEEKVGNMPTHRITVSDAEWEDVKTVVNDAFNHFVGRLQQTYPQLGNKDICFCCLVKINVNLQDLSDIYCVSKSAITKRKYRIKREKLGISDETISLDTFLQSF